MLENEGKIPSVLKHRSNEKINLTRKISHESTSTENDLLSPTLEMEMPMVEQSIPEKKKQRGSFIQKKWNFFDLKPKNRDDNKLSDNYKKQLTSTLSVPHITSTVNIDMMTDKDSVVSGSIESPPFRRPDSLDITSVDTISSWEGFSSQSRFKKMSCGSEDDMSDTYSLPSVIDEKIHEDIEDVLREDTLLRKRRNSLTLERTQIACKLEALRETDNIIANTLNNNNNTSNSKKHSKQIIEKLCDETAVLDSEKKKEKMHLLEQKLEDIDIKIENIDKRIHLRLKPNTRDGSAASGARQMTKLRLNTCRLRPLNDLNSQSVESLSSSASRESSQSADLFRHKKSILSRPKKLTIARTPDSEDGIVSPIGSNFSGIEELMITTQRLENSSSKEPPMSPQYQSSPVGIWRSKSLGSMELMKNKSMLAQHNKTDVNQNNAHAKHIIEVNMIF